MKKDQSSNKSYTRDENLMVKKSPHSLFTPIIFTDDLSHKINVSFLRAILLSLFRTKVMNHDMHVHIFKHQTGVMVCSNWYTLHGSPIVNDLISCKKSKLTLSVNIFFFVVAIVAYRKIDFLFSPLINFMWDWTHQWSTAASSSSKVVGTLFFLWF